MSNCQNSSSTLKDELSLLDRTDSTFNSQDIPIISPFTPYKKPRHSTSPKYNLSTCSSSSCTVQASKLSQFSSLKLIGRGGSSHIFSAFNNNQKVTIKCINIPLSSSKEISNFLSHSKMLCSLKNKFVLKHHSGFLESGFPRLVTEFCECGTLSSLITTNPSLPIGAAILLCRQLAEGLKYIHSNNIIHSDISSSNILISSRLNIKIGDFGLSHKTNCKTNKNDGDGHFRYIAPEVVKFNKTTKKSDIFSLGLVFLRIISLKQLPKSGKGWEKLRSGYKCKIKKNGLEEIINDMLKVKSEERPDINKVDERLKGLHKELLKNVKNKSQRNKMFRIIKPEAVEEQTMSFSESVSGLVGMENLEKSLSMDGSNSPIKKIKPMNLFGANF